MSQPVDAMAREYRRRICRAVDYINQNLAENPSVDEIARAAPFSKFHFQRLFKALIGESVAEFTRRVRLETAARRLLFNPGVDITGLAFDLGFSSSLNFAKAFRKQFSASPSEYRRRHTQSDVTTSSPPGEESSKGNIDRTNGNARSDDDSYDPATVLIWARTEDIVINVEVINMPAFRVVYRRHFGSYHNDPEIQAAFDELRRWAEPRGLHDPQRCIGIPWDDSDVTPGDKCRFDACQIIDDEVRVDVGINSHAYPGGQYAVYHCQVAGHDFDRPWTELMQNWLPFSGYQPADGPRFERYLSDGSSDSEGCWQIDICLPVQPL